MPADSQQQPGQRSLNREKIEEIKAQHNIPKEYDLYAALSLERAVYRMSEQTDTISSREREKFFKRLSKTAKSMHDLLCRLKLEDSHFFQRDIPQLDLFLPLYDAGLFKKIEGGGIIHRAMTENLPSEMPDLDLIGRLSMVMEQIQSSAERAAENQQIAKQQRMDRKSMFFIRIAALYRDATGRQDGASKSTDQQVCGPFVRFLEDVADLLEFRYQSSEALVSSYRRAIRRYGR